MKCLVIGSLMLMSAMSAADVGDSIKGAVKGCGAHVESDVGMVKVILPNKLQFDTGSSKPFAGMDTILCLVRIIKETELNLLVTGYADPKGSVEDNVELSYLRASKVKDLLVSYGVMPGRVNVEAKGESDLISDNYYMRVLNRRVELKFIL